MPKRYVDCNTNELEKTLVSLGDVVQAVTFSVGSKNTEFKAENYPDAPSDEPAMEFVEYMGGANKPPNLMKFE